MARDEPVGGKLGIAAQGNARLIRHARMPRSMPVAWKNGNSYGFRPPVLSVRCAEE